MQKIILNKNVVTGNDGSYLLPAETRDWLNLHFGARQHSGLNDIKTWNAALENDNVVFYFNDNASKDLLIEFKLRFG